jgi:hypothetical protein
LLKDPSDRGSDKEGDATAEVVVSAVELRRSHPAVEAAAQPTKE